MRVEKDFKEFIGLLNDQSVKYLIVGGFAVAFHGKPRNTKDLDIWIEPTIDNATKMINVLNLFGFGDLEIEPQDFLNENTVIQLGYSPIRIDLMSAISGVPKFADAWQNRSEGKYGEQPTYFIGLEELIANKKAANRLQDLTDVEILLKVKNKLFTRKR